MVAILLADGFEEAEALVPCDILRRGGAEVVLVGVTGLGVTGAHGIRITADKLLEEVNAGEVEMLVLPGGMGYQILRDTDRVGLLIDAVAAMGHTVAAICAAPNVLGGRGLLDGRRAVCYPGMEDGMGRAEICSGEQVVQDGGFITGEGPGSAFEFGYELLEKLKGHDVMEEVKHGMYFRY